MKRVSLFLLLATFLLNISEAKGRVKKEVVKEQESHVVLRWTKEGLKVYELADPEDARFVVEESKLRGEKANVFRGDPQRIYLSCALGYFLLEGHPRVNLKLLSADIKRKCSKCKPIDCGVSREEAIELLEKGGAKDIANDVRETYRKIREES